MASNRQVSTAFWTDSWVETLKSTEKLLFLYLLTNPQTNVAGVYELSLSRVVFESGIDMGAVTKALDKFAAAGKVLYVDGWVIVRNFQKYQNQESPHIKAGVERILSILPETVKTAFDTVAIGSTYHIQALSHSYSDSNLDSNLTDCACDEGFSEFWSLYPSKTAKQAALKKYRAAVKSGVSHSAIMAGLRRYVDKLARENTEPRFIAHPATWLNQGRWEDSEAVPPKRTKRIKVCPKCGAKDMIGRTCLECGWAYDNDPLEIKYIDVTA